LSLLVLPAWFASGPAATATAARTPPTATAAARPGTPTTTATEAIRTRRTRPRFIDGNRAPPYLSLIELFGRADGLFLSRHLNEREATGAPGSHVAHDLHGFHLTDTSEQLLQLGFRDLEWEIPYEQLATH